MIHNDFTMALIMNMSGLLSSMYIWSDKLSDVHITLNDIYMVTLMIVWMFFFMGLINSDYNYIIFSSIGIILTLWLIRKQILINKRQYFKGMITHHSMAVLMSRKLLDKKELMTKEEINFVKNIIENQEKEIKLMKRMGY